MQGWPARLQASRKDVSPWVDEQTRLLVADKWPGAKNTTLRVGSYDFRIHHIPQRLASELESFSSVTEQRAKRWPI